MCISLPGTGSEGNVDGLAAKCRLHQPTGLCSEFDNVLYVTDYQAGTLKIFSTMESTAKFFGAIGKLFNAFSVHEKRSKYDLKTLQEAIDLTGEGNRIICELEKQVRDYKDDLPAALTGKHGFASTKTLVSIDLVEWSLKNLQENIVRCSVYGGYDVNLLSMMTLSIEHFHAAAHSKAVLMSQLGYARSFSNTMKESFKRLSTWSAHYFTSQKGSWYPPAEGDIPYQKLRPPPTRRTPIKISKSDAELLQDWSLTYTRSVRQTTNRQLTTMAKMGTMPDYLYSGIAQDMAESTSPFNMSLDYGMTSADTIDETEPEDTDQITDIVIDTGSVEIEAVEPVSSVTLEQVRRPDPDWAEIDDEVNDTADLSNQDAVDDSVLFMVGRATRYGRSIKVSNRLY